MKKILKLLFIILVAFTILPIKTWAEEEGKNLVIDFSKITCEWDISMNQETGLNILEYNGILRSLGEDISYLLNSEGKQLVKYQNNKIEVLDEVDESDNIEYTLTEEDYNNLTEYLPKYNKIIVKFGKANFDATDYVILVEEGKNFLDFSEYANGGAAYDFPRKGILNTAIMQFIQSPEGKTLFTLDSMFFDDANVTINIPNDVTEEDDITYLVTEEIRAKSIEQYGDDRFDRYDKVILNFSGKDYSNENDRTLVINFHEMDLYNYPDNLLNLLSTQNVIKMSGKLSLQSLGGKDLAYYEITQDMAGANEFEMFSKWYVKIPDDVGEDDTIIYEFDDELREIFPENYQRLVIKFIPKEKESPAPPIDNIIENPQTFNNILIVLGIISIVLIGTIFPKLKKINNRAINKK